MKELMSVKERLKDLGITCPYMGGMDNVVFISQPAPCHLFDGIECPMGEKQVKKCYALLWKKRGQNSV
jgi:hypothetical protein